MIKPSLLLLPVIIFAGQADHLIFSRITINPSEAEMVAIYNPTNESVNLSNYYLTDATKYIDLPEANFSSDVTSGDSPLVVRFSDESTGGTFAIVDWQWNFGDGEVSNERNPTHIYSEPGSYTVKLTVTDAKGFSAVEEKDNYILVSDFPYYILHISADGAGYDLTFGFSSEATDDFDEGLDSIAPPLTSNIFGAALVWPAGTNNLYYTQILDTTAEERVWEIKLEFPADEIIIINWDNNGWADEGEFLLQDAFGGLVIDLDMTVEDTLVLDNPAFSLLKLIVTPNTTDKRKKRTITDLYDNHSPGLFYHNLPTGENFWSGDVFDFIARFPENAVILPGDTLILGLHNDSLFANYYGFAPDLSLFVNMRDAVEGINTISGGASFVSMDMLQNAEVLILFKWEPGQSIVQDVDYFLWGNNSSAVNKTDTDGYLPDTPVENQIIIHTHGEDSTYVRISNEETGETTTGGNGITGHDETGENLNLSWQVIYQPELVYGCTDPDAPNFNPDATRDDGSCLVSFASIIDGQYDCGLDSRDACPPYLTCPIATIQGLIVDYFDVTVFNGPHSITLEDEDGYRLEVTIWPNQWDIVEDSLFFLIEPPFNRYVMKATGNVFEYRGDKQLMVCGPEDFTVVKSYNFEGVYNADSTITKTEISPEPFVIIPTLGEKLDFSYSFPSNSRVIIRIFDLSGRFITSLVDQYYEESGIVHRNEAQSAWDGRDHLGQIVPPGTYFMHIEANNFKTGKTHTDIAPVVVGVKF